jgi:long-chain acyl-CoA synthetase
LTSASLLSKALDSHPPDVIITNASFVPQVIEHIYDSAEHEHHTLIVLGDVAKPRDVEGINVFKWEEIERQGIHIPPVVPSGRGMDIR